MNIDLKRTFSQPGESLNMEDDPYEDASFWLTRNREPITWSELYKKVLTVVVGEAGIGKTYEFKNEVNRLKAQGEYAFFLELNLLDSTDSWSLALGENESEFMEWKIVDSTGFFFLDAVDEARLESPAALKRALLVVMKTLAPNLNRVKICLSSRWTDWTMPEVQKLVDRLMLEPIVKSLKEVHGGTNHILKGDVTKQEKKKSEDSTDDTKVFIASLNPLSLDEAKRFSNELGVTDNDSFWAAVNDGEYEKMATRPLDLQWMVDLWRQHGKLGTYLELIENNVINRLKETNPNYISSNTISSPYQLRTGAEILAAGITFAGRSYISLRQGEIRKTEIEAAKLLPKWSEIELQRLLSTAVFDEATYNRSKFHHRSSREYLAACWVNRQIKTGLPFHQALSLFAVAPFADLVIIPSRRWTLCWLAAINIEVQEWVTRNFPELIIFDGDPEAWSDRFANQAFKAYLKRVSQGLWLEWTNSSSEYRRVARKISDEYINSILVDAEQPIRVKLDLLPFISHGKLKSCSDSVFQFYTNADLNNRELTVVLQALQTIASPSQREEIKTKLTSGAIDNNTLIAVAIGVIGVEKFTIEELSATFDKVSDENENALHPMVQFVEWDLLPKCDYQSAEIVLAAVIKSFPDLTECKSIVKYPESSRPEKSWMIQVLPNCFARYLAQLPKNKTNFSEICLRAAEEIESLWNTSYADQNLYHEICELIGKFETLRWELAIRFVLSGRISNALSRLTLGRHSLIYYSQDDLCELIKRANDLESNAELRGIWFSIALDITMSDLKGSCRKEALNKLIEQDSDVRRAIILSKQAKLLKNKCHFLDYKREERRRKRERGLEQQTRKNKLLAQIEDIRAGTARDSIKSLIYDYDGGDLYHTNFNLIGQTYGKKLALALARGLKKSWEIITSPNPNNYKNGGVPWDAIILSNGANLVFGSDADFSKLEASDIEKAASIAVWQIDSPPEWFETLARFDEDQICHTLHPWIIEEATVVDNTWRIRRATSLALNCSKDIRSALLLPIVELLRDDKVKDPEILRQLCEQLHKDGSIQLEEYIGICEKELGKAEKQEGEIKDLSWLRIWLENDIKGAWTWFRNELKSAGNNVESYMKKFAQIWGQTDLLQGNIDMETINVMVEIFRATSEIINTGTSKKFDNFPFRDSLPDLRNSIPHLLEKIPILAANVALAKIAAEYPDSKNWIRSRQLMQASMVAQITAISDPETILSNHAVFTNIPDTEGQLYQQVLGRLEEIKIGIEEGPFSERIFMKSGFDESYLQVWLASRLKEIQNRRFGVHREEEVDMKNKTDIQVSCNAMNICIEIKPVDRDRGYSANSLVKTLTDQIVEKYLKGYNSAHGILVLFRLDDKTWEIPGKGRKKSFSDLVEYLREQAQIITTNSPTVKALAVVGFDCCP